MLTVTCFCIEVKIYLRCKIANRPFLSSCIFDDGISKCFYVGNIVITGIDFLSSYDDLRKNLHVVVVLTVDASSQLIIAIYAVQAFLVL